MRKAEYTDYANDTLSVRLRAKADYATFGIEFDDDLNSELLVDLDRGQVADLVKHLQGWLAD